MFSLKRARRIMGIIINMFLFIWLFVWNWNNSWWAFNNRDLNKYSKWVFKWRILSSWVTGWVNINLVIWFSAKH
jgi:hypothetical protein